MTSAVDVGVDTGGPYVPELVCPNCKEIVLLDRSTYHWYEGEVGCPECHAMLSVKVGDGNTQGLERREVAQPPFPSLVPTGGFLLEPPMLVRHGNVFPEVLTLGVQTASVPIQVKRSIRQAVQHYSTGHFFDTVVRCRYTIETVLADGGVQAGILTNMIEQARQRRIITPPVEALCRAVVAYGNRGAHPPEKAGTGGVTWTDALTVIGMTANIVRSIYLTDEPSQ